MAEKYCFVIQPFQETFDKRYEDVFAPAIRNAGLTPYRVDRDPSAKILIANIEQKINEASICLADISIDNPNVWYELGYAFASKKEVVMVCDKQRQYFPFDVRHISIITYQTDSKRDFDVLEKQISEKLKAFLSQQPVYIPSTSSRAQEFPQGLQPFESALLAIIIGEQKTWQESASILHINLKMNNAGFTDAATSIGIRLLRNKGYIESFIDQDCYGNDFDACRLTPKGEHFTLSNWHLFELYIKKDKAADMDKSNDLPF